MNHLRALVAASASTLVVLALGCENSGHNTASGPYPGNGQPVEGSQVGATNAQASNADATVVEQLSAARCDREQSCNNVGNGQRYVSRDVCMNAMRGSIANDLNAYNCPRGIERDGLMRCMAGIRAEECGHPLDTLARMDQCRTSSMCLK